LGGTLCKIGSPLLSFLLCSLCTPLQSNHIIFYNHIGHFGSEYALSSRFNKAKILSFSQLKHKTGKNILFRLLNIVTAIVTFILNETKKGDARTTISTILSNMENIYCCGQAFL